MNEKYREKHKKKEEQNNDDFGFFFSLSLYRPLELVFIFIDCNVSPCKRFVAKYIRTKRLKHIGLTYLR